MLSGTPSLTSYFTMEKCLIVHLPGGNCWIFWLIYKDWPIASLDFVTVETDHFMRVRSLNPCKDKPCHQVIWMPQISLWIKVFDRPSCKSWNAYSGAAWHYYFFLTERLHSLSMHTVPPVSSVSTLLKTVVLILNHLKYKNQVATLYCTPVT